MMLRKWKQVTLTLALASLLAGCGNEEPASTAAESAPAAPAAPAVDKAALVAEAKGAVKDLGGQLQQQLQTAMKASGPAEAVNVCHKIAPQIAQSISEQRGVELTRVSLKNRNPEMGEPNDWQVKVLEDFDARKVGGEDPQTISYAEVVGDEFRFMKAIPTAAVCLNCHGAEIKPEVAEMIDKWYPNDEARGYSEGDIRGAFVVTKSLQGS
jgi:hypothetical protein